MKEYTCKHCGAKFTDRFELTGHVTKFHAKRNGSSEAREMREAAYLKKPNHCAECGKILGYDDRKKTFCNSSCSASHNNRNRKVVTTFICKECGEEVALSYPGQKRTYCSPTCQGKARKEVTIREWLSTGKLSLSTSGQIANPKTIKEYILKDQSDQCDICGISPIWNGKAFSVLFLIM
jgi:endogenous inhibitor of DNA gyrase (YacG/DUF329 family)